MDKPTKEQIKKFWEWCGFFKVDYADTMPWRFPASKGYECYFGIPDIDLNNLFKYAVPKVLEKVGKYETVVLVNNAVCNAVEASGKIDEFLFWAIWEVIKNGS